MTFRLLNVLLFGCIVLLVESKEKVKVDDEISQKSCPHTPIEDKCKPFKKNNGTFQIPIPSEQEIANSGHLLGLKPLRYDLSLTFDYDGGFTEDEVIPFSGQVTITLKTIKTTSRIMFHLNQEVNMFDEIQLTEHCSSKAICIKAVTSNPETEEVLIELGSDLKTNSSYDLTISFKGFKDTESRGIYNSEENKDTFAIITVFQTRYARKVFPCLDHPALKANFVFCLKYRKGQYALSNTKTEKHVDLKNGLTESCFRKTPPIPTYTFTFAITKGYGSRDRPSNDTKKFPTIVSLVKPSEKQDKLQFIIPEAKKILERMIEITKTPYGLDRLIFVNVAPAPYEGIENYGLIAMDAAWMEDPQLDRPHEILAHEIVHQWLGNSFTISYWNEICLQEGLTGYMMWKLSSELKSSTNSFLMKLQEGRAEALRSELRKSKPIIQPVGDTDEIFDCFKKPPQVFHMIEQAFGEGTNDKFLAYMSQKYKFSNAGLEEWKEGYINVTGKTEAGDMLDAWFTEKGFPLLAVTKTDNNVIIKQQTVENDTTIVDKVTFPLYVEFIDSTGQSGGKFMEKNTLSFDSDPEANWILVDPNNHTFSRVIYPVANYMSLFECFNDISTDCSLELGQIISVYDDFCWGLFHDQFPIENDEFDNETWEELFENLNRVSANREMRLSCEICLKTEDELNDEEDFSSKRHQKDWVKKCKKLKIIGLLGRKYDIEVGEPKRRF